MTELNSEKFEELEKLASEFIIGYKPLSEQQKIMLVTIEKLQRELDLQKGICKKIEQIIDAIRQEIAKGDSK